MRGAERNQCSKKTRVTEDARDEGGTLLGLDPETLGSCTREC